MTRTCLAAAVLLAWSLSVLGCHSPPPTDSTAPDASVPDTGESWDGSYTVLEEKGNWTQPAPPPFAPCSFVPGDGNTCSGGHFDLSACDRDTPTSLQDPGYYFITERSDSSGDGPFEPGISSLLLSSGAQAPILNGWVATDQPEWTFDRAATRQALLKAMLAGENAATVVFNEKRPERSVTSMPLSSTPSTCGPASSPAPWPSP